MNNSRKKRYARRLDSPRTFKPLGISRNALKSNVVNLDEFEALRLCDLEGLSQIEAAEDMQVSRATIQRLLLSGRKKIIEAVLLNKVIEVKNDIRNIKLKGENKMNIEEKEVKVVAFPTTDKVTVDAHFGHTKYFAIFQIKENDIIDVKYVPSPPHEPGLLPQFLGEQGIHVIITGGMGQMAVNLFNRQNIDVVLGANGRIDVNLNEYLGGFLTSQGSSCDHTVGDQNHGH
jgi:predicted DNA-binding protein (UPF0251 family)/predicted Fe-Mo cluster-binding NifX family protein